jgi:hypothetical protein
MAIDINKWSSILPLKFLRLVIRNPIFQVKDFLGTKLPSNMVNDFDARVSEHIT